MCLVVKIMSRWTSDQEKAITQSGTNIIVSAGAGSGKTAVLTERAKRKVLEGIHVNELLVLTFTNAAAAENAKNADSLIAAENARVEEAKKVAAAKIEEIQEQIRSCVQALERIKEANRPAAPAAASGTAFDFDRSEGENRTDAVADEIASNIEALVGTTDEPAPKAEANHPASDTTSKFANLQFGRNYDPENR